MKNNVGTGIDTEKIRSLYEIGNVSTHFEGCWENHTYCAIIVLCNEVDALRAKIEELEDRLKELGVE